MSDGPWNPCDEGLAPIVAALQRLIAEPRDSLRDKLKYHTTRPSATLAEQLNAPGMGDDTRSAGYAEMVRRWLQTNGFAQDSIELNQRLQDILKRLRLWQDKAIADLPPTDSRRPYSDELCEEYDEIVDFATDTVDYIRQLEVTLEGKLQNRRPKNDNPPLTPLSWRDAQKKLDTIRSNGEVFTSLREMAAMFNRKGFSCSYSLIRKAIAPDEEALSNLNFDDRCDARQVSGRLKEWQEKGKPQKRPRVPTQTSLNNPKIKNSLPQTTESNPNIVMPDDEVDRTMNELITQAQAGGKLEEATRMKNMDSDSRRRLAKAYQEQLQDSELSPLDRSRRKSTKHITDW